MDHIIDFATVVIIMTVFAAGHNEPKEPYVPPAYAIDYRDSLDAVRDDFKAIRDSAQVLYVETNKNAP